MRRTMVTRYISLCITLLSICGMVMTVNAITGTAKDEMTTALEVKLTNELAGANEYLATVQEENKDTLAAPMIDLFINLQDEEFINDITADDETQDLLAQIQEILNKYNIK